MSRCLVIALLLVGCGESAPPAEGAVSVAVSFQAAQMAGCADVAALQGMEATLYVGGYLDSPCQLDVAADLSVSGRCAGITVGIERPLVIVYSLAYGSGSAAGLAFNIGSVNLTKDAVGDQQAISVNLDGVQSLIIYQPEDYEALALAQPSTDPLENARHYVWDPIIAEGHLAAGFHFDDDRDGCSNLAEACGGTLDQVLAADCP